MIVRIFFYSLLLLSPVCCASPVNITVTDSVTYHSHPPGTPFQVVIEAVYDSRGGADSVYYEWLDADGKPLGNGVKIALPPGAPQKVSSPDGSTGYVELCFTASPSLALPDRNPGEPRSYGFALITPRGNTPNPNSYFGTVHPDSSNLYLPTFTKNLWWAGTPANWWGTDIAELTHHGKLEIGIFASKSMTGGVEWTTQPDDTVVISSTQLKAIQNEAQAYLSGYANGTNSGAAFVELGLEEELSQNFNQPYYFQNLAAKAKACRMAADAAGATNVKFIYQIVQANPGNENSGLYKFLASPAAAYFDVLSLHVYAWPDFPTPETFVVDLVTTTRQWMQKLNQVKSIWYTETGIPVNDPPVAGFEDGGHPVTGGSKPYAASFIVKLHTLSLAVGVERLFWYSYQNGFLSRTDAEANFGTIDYSGFPLPTYAAQWNLVDKLDNKRFLSNASLPGNVWSYRFQDSNHDTFVLWTYPKANTLTPLSSVKPMLDRSQVLQCVDKVARPYPLDGNSVIVTSDPIFIVTKAGN